MGKDSVCSWRITAKRKAVRRARAVGGNDDENQQRIREAAQRCIGTIAGGDPERASQVRERLCEKLRAGRG